MRENFTFEKLHTGFYCRFVFLFFLIICISVKGFNQVSITALSTAFTEDFTSLGSSATATVPTGFKVNTAADWTTGTTATTQAAGTTGIGALTNTSTGGAYNFANGVTASSIDRALGFLTSGSYTSPRYIVYAFTNNSGAIITNLNITFSYEKYRFGKTALDMAFFYGSNAVSINTAASSGNQSYTADGSNVAVDPPTTINKTVSITGLSIAMGSTYYLAWSYTVAGSTNAQGVGIDNFSITATSTVINSYTWKFASGNNDFQVSSNWTPARSTLYSNDILNFSNGGTPGVTNIPTQTIGQLLISNNTTLTLKDVTGDGTVSTLTLSGSTGTDFSVPAGSTLNFDVNSNNSSEGMVISVSAGVTGTIDGNLNFDNTKNAAQRAHQLLATDASSIVVGSTGYITAKHLLGNPFGTTGGKNVIIFSSGSVYEAQDGANPFGFSLPDSKVIFSTGSLYKHNEGGIPSLAGRVYADVEFAYNGAITRLLNGSSNPVTIDNLIIDAGTTFNLNPTGSPGEVDIQLKKNMTIDGVLSYKPGSASTLRFVGTSQQQISIGNSGNLNLGSNLEVIVNNAAGALLNHDITIDGLLTLTNGTFAINGNKLTLNGPTSTNTNGRLTGSSSSSLVIGSGVIINPLYLTKNIFPANPYNNYLKILNLNTSSAVTLADSLNIAAGTYSSPGTLTATGTLNTSGVLTLKSNAVGDSRVANSSGNITGNVIVERYIPANRAWRFLSMPFNSSNQTINQAWQEGAIPYPNSSVSLYQDIQHNPKPGYGTEITYLHNSNASGFDENITENPSLKTWDYVTKTWSVAAPNTLSSNILDYQAYCLFVRGDRSIDLATGVYASPNATTLRATGVLNQINNGSPVIKNFGSRSAGEFIFVGNPYASAVNLESVLNNSTGIDKTTFWVWDPGVTTGNDVGAYVTYNTTTGISAPAGSTYSGGKFAQSGQAFFVKASGGVPMVSFSESDKTASETNVYSRRKVPVYAVIYTNLMGSTGNGLIDGVAFAFDKQFSATVDADDATKLWNFNENIALVRDTKNLAIEFRPKPGVADTMFFRLYLRKDQSYALKFFAQNLKDIAKNARLIDKYLNAETKIDLSDTALFSFNTNADTNSYRNRFMLILNADNNQFTGYPTIYANVRAPFESSSELVDGVAAGFSNEFAAAVDGDDAQKIWNFNENMSLARDGKNLAIEFRPKPVNTDTLFFKLWLRQNQPYSLQVYSRNIADNFKGQTILVDKYLNTEMPVNLFDTTLYTFTPDADTNSYRNRFMLVYKGEDKPAKSSAVIAHAGIVTGGIKVFPNPATGEKVMLQFSNMQQGNYEITAFNRTGEKLFGTKISHAGGNNAYRLSLNSMWAAGIYTIKILHEGSKKEINLPLVISK